MIASSHSHRSRTPQPGGTKWEVPGSTASCDAGIPWRSPITPPPSSSNISTACCSRTPSESPTTINVGAAMSRMSSSGQAKSVVSSRVSLSTSWGKAPGFGAWRRYASSIGDPAKSSGDIDGNICKATEGMPSRRYDAEATTSLRTTSG